MKYCIYAGAIYKVTSETGKLLCLTGMFENTMAQQEQVKEIPEDMYLQVKDEYEGAVKELTNVEHRLWRLNEEYHKKHSALIEMRTDAGQKEKGVINKLLNQIYVRGGLDDGKMDKGING